eukprot:TRINITY_DN5840_c0_g1_i1.p1 TRINITY_DN5840_c0_g1~~TRINITY_DN5840_c0_g1_i1.p1  ORF type:complete len:491 (+),score=115.53 TRINITY_DN5840_c0_g1_i1:14-1486(+)
MKVEIWKCVVINILIKQVVGFYSPNVAKIDGYSLVSTYKNGTLYNINSAAYSAPIQVLNLAGTHFEIGEAYGYLMAAFAIENYNALLNSQLTNWIEKDTLETFLDWQWKSYLSKQLPEDFQNELAGLEQGSKEAGYPDMITKVTRMLVLSSFPGDVPQNIEWLLRHEFFGNEAKVTEEMKELIKESGREKRGDGECSQFAVWGSRTVNNTLYSGRNLDWFNNTGISNHKLITVYHPYGKTAHVTVGFAGMIGALTGISKNGITVGESGLDQKLETLEGFVWTLRLRFLMENAYTIEEARQIWEATNNTLGMNHVIASGKEKIDNPAMALETMFNYTSYFYANDPREADFIYTDPKTGQKTQMGWPIPEAIWRTNHVYDPVMRKEELYPTLPDDDSEFRYMLFSRFFDYQEQIGNLIDDLDAINITSIAGAKGELFSFEDCSEASGGSNILSVVYHPEASNMWVAFEEGTGQDRLPAACATYLQIDLSHWW